MPATDPPPTLSETITSLLALLGSTGIIAWLRHKSRDRAEVRQIELQTEDAHDRLISELRQADANAHKVSVSTLIEALEASRTLAEDYKLLSENIQARHEEERAQWEQERTFLIQRLQNTEKRIAELEQQQEEQARITEAQTIVISKQQEEIADLRQQNRALKQQLTSEQQKRRQLEERIDTSSRQ